MHVLVVGMTCNGKSTLCKSLAKSLKRDGCAVVVADPRKDEGWEYHTKVSKIEEVKEVFDKSTNCHVFLDDAGRFYNEDRKFMESTATDGRHKGHVVYYIIQRGEMLSPTIRGQCSDLYLFRVGLQDAENFAREWGFPELRDASQLKKGEFFRCTTEVGSLARCKIF